jgi:hypothetical protein
MGLQKSLTAYAVTQVLFFFLFAACTKLFVFSCFDLLQFDFTFCVLVLISWRLFLPSYEYVSFVLFRFSSLFSDLCLCFVTCSLFSYLVM